MRLKIYKLRAIVPKTTKTVEIKNFTVIFSLKNSPTMPPKTIASPEDKGYWTDDGTYKRATAKRIVESPYNSPFPIEREKKSGLFSVFWNDLFLMLKRI